MIKKIILALLVSSQAIAGTMAKVDVDILRSSDHTKVWTPPAASDTLVGRVSVDTLTNKTINGSNNTLSNIAYSSLLLGTSILTSDLASGLLVPTGKGGTGVTTVTTSPTASAFAGWDANSNLSANSVLLGYATTATAASTTTLTVSSAYQQFFTGSTTQIVQLPVTSTLVLGMSFEIVNNSTGAVTVKSSGSNTVTTVAASSSAVVTCILTSGATAASWSSVGSVSSPLNTKGDIYTYSSTNVRHAAPADYGVAVADSAQTDGWRNISASQREACGPGKNYIQYCDFENAATTGWVLSNIPTITNGLPASNSPTFGSGASGNLSLVATAAATISGSDYMAITSSAATTKGDAICTSALSIDPSDEAKVLSFYFDYTPTSNGSNANWSGTSSNSFGMAVWDATNSVWLNSTGNFNLVQSSGIGHAFGTTQTGATTASVRFCIYNVAATSGAITLGVDNFHVGPNPQAPNGPAMTDMAAYTMVVTGSSSNPTLGTNTQAAYWKRVGDSIEINYQLAMTGAGTAGSGTYEFSLPPGLAFDSTVATTTSTNLANGQIIGDGFIANNNTSNTAASRPMTIAAYSSTQMAIVDTQSSWDQTVLVGSGDFAFSASTAYITFKVKAKIAGWSSNTSMSSDTDTRVVAFAATNVAGTAQGTTDATIPWVSTFDTNGGFNGTDTYKIQVQGYYDIIAQSVSASAASNQVQSTTIYKNGVAISEMDGYGPSGIIFGEAKASVLSLCVPGDLILIKTRNNQSIALSTTAGYNLFKINRLSGPAVIAATESVSARYSSTAGQSLTTGTPTVVNFDTKDWDDHNAVTTGSAWKFTAPVSGKYQVCVDILFAASSATGERIVYFSKNGGSTERLASGAGNTTSYPSFSPCRMANLLAGDYIQISADQSSGGTLALASSDAVQQISIDRVGN